MKKILILFVCIAFICNLNAQIKGIPVEGKCFEVIEALRYSLKNDTLAVNFFKNHYTVSDINNPDDLYKKDISEIIHFFNNPQKKDSYKCYIKGLRERNVLLIE